MRTKKKRTDYGAISRSSIKKDFQRVQRYPTEEKTPQIEELPKINAERRIIHISDVSGYAKFARYIVGKLVRLKEKANVGGNSWYCEFVHDIQVKPRILKSSTTAVALRPFRWQPQNEDLRQRTGGKSRSVPSGTTLYCKMGWQRLPISTLKRAINFILRGN